MEAGRGDGEDGTRALLRFAAASAGEDVAGAEPASYDDARVDASSLGEAIAKEVFWDAGRPGLRLRDRAMAGVSLRHADLSGADLARSDLSGVKGAGIVLTDSCLEGTNFAGADLIGASLCAASAGEANFSEALLEDANLHGAHLRFARFADTIMDGANLSDADLWGANFNKAAAERADFRRSRLDESSLAGADMAAADFTGASLRQADLTGARLRGATLRDAVMDGANLAGADLTGAVLPNVSLSACMLTHARFAGAWLERTRMRSSQLGGQVGEEVAGDLEGAIESYIVLEQNFLSLGSKEDASWAYRRRRRVGRRLHGRESAAAFGKRKWATAGLSAAQWLGDSVAEWLCDYGESVGRVVRAFFAILIGFALLYWLTGSLGPREGFMVIRHSSAVVSYLLFSLDSMTKGGTSEVALRPSGELGLLLSSLQTVVGTILLGLFGFVLGARIRK